MKTDLQFKKSLLSILLASTVAVAPLAIVAQANPDKHPQDEQQEVSQSAEQGVEQQWKAGLVEGAYLFNTSLNNFKIDVDVTGSTATIEGNVDTDVEKSLAEEIALSIDGIDKVDNRLTVASSSDKDAMQAAEVDQDQSDSKTFKEKLSDAAITTKVKSRLIANPQATGLDINVDTEDGTVTLNGQVESDTEKELAFYIAHNTGGVVSVKNRIEVKDPQDKTAAIN